MCVETLIPSLFPFFVLSSLAVSLGVSEILGGFFSKFMKPLFRCSPEVSSAFVLGLLSGFPVGASSAARLYEKGKISRGDFSRALAFTNNPSVGFIVSAVGVGLFKSAGVGWLLYFSVTVSAVFSGMTVCRLFPDDPFRLEVSENKGKGGFLEAFLSSVKDGGTGVLNVSCFVIFFSVLCGISSEIFSFSYPFSALFSGFFEIASGVFSVNSAVSCFSVAAAAAILAWSGLSVHCQVLFSVRGVGVSVKPYFFSKALGSVIAALISFLVMFFKDAFLF